MNSVDAVNKLVNAPAPSAATPIPSEQLAQQRELIQAVKAVNASELFGENSELTFAMDRKSQRPVVRILDRKTKEVLQQIPPEYVLRMAEGLSGRVEQDAS
jgi:flagellar protein FlaG